jgi:hypothetical protein
MCFTLRCAFSVRAPQKIPNVMPIDVSGGKFEGERAVQANLVTLLEVNRKRHAALATKLCNLRSGFP